MSKIAYLDCPTGIAGDMCLGALIHAGVPLTYLREQLAKLGIKQEYSLATESVQRNQQAATKFHVHLLIDASSANAEAMSAHGAVSIATHHHQDTAAQREDQDDAVIGSDSEAIAHAHSHTHGDAHSHGHQHHTNTHQHQAHSHHESHSDLHHHHSSTSGDGHDSHHHQSHTHSHHRNLPDIEQLIRQAQLPPRAEAWSLEVFRNLAIAEATVHGTTIEEVHFHEVGAVDAIVDIVGTCLGLDYLDIDEIYCSPLPTGGGTVWAAHGRLPVPAPAVLKLFAMGQVPVYGNGIERELVTPTGAAIAITLAKGFGPPPAMRLQTIGLGAGTIDLPLPNILRIWIGEAEGGGPQRKQSTHRSHSKPTQLGQIPSDKPQVSHPQIENNHSDATPSDITLLQTQLDDLSPQAIGYAFDLLLEAGALDVFTQAIAMKKNRPGILLNVLCPDDKIADCETILFRETSTLGIRRQPQQRSILKRHWQTVSTIHGPIRIKVAELADGADGRKPLNIQPEYEDCAAIARTHNLPWRDVHQLALQAWHQVQT